MARMRSLSLSNAALKVGSVLSRFSALVADVYVDGVLAAIRASLTVNDATATCARWLRRSTRRLGPQQGPAAVGKEAP